MIEGDPPLNGMSWLWVALRTEKELTSMVAGGSDRSHDVQRNDLVEHLAALKTGLVSMNNFCTITENDAASAAEPQAAAVPKAKAKAKHLLRPMRHARR